MTQVLPSRNVADTNHSYFLLAPFEQNPNFVVGNNFPNPSMNQNHVKSAMRIPFPFASDWWDRHVIWSWSMRFKSKRSWGTPGNTFSSWWERWKRKASLLPTLFPSLKWHLELQQFILRLGGEILVTYLVWQSRKIIGAQILDDVVELQSQPGTTCLRFVVPEQQVMSIATEA